MNLRTLIIDAKLAGRSGWRFQALQRLAVSAGAPPSPAR
jgi:hypothetical protein